MQQIINVQIATENYLHFIRWIRDYYARNVTSYLAIKRCLKVMIKIPFNPNMSLREAYKIAQYKGIDVVVENDTIYALVEVSVK